MTLAYYPGCTLKTKAANLEIAAVEALRLLGVEFAELERWNCCGAVFSLATDDLIHQVAPIRDLVRVQQAGHDTVFSLCSQCYNTLARANLLVRNEPDKLETLNAFMDTEPDYDGSVNVRHYLEILRDEVGWDAVQQAVAKPLEGLKVAAFYGCTLTRPTEVAVAGGLLESLVTALGGEPVSFAAAAECCGSYQMLAHPEEGLRRAATVLGSVDRSGADCIILGCPLCEYNLGTRQDRVIEVTEGLRQIPTFYFPQLLGAALGISPDKLRLELNQPSAAHLLAERHVIAAVSA
jgi:heterodisulfide reductase subunit B